MSPSIIKNSIIIVSYIPYFFTQPKIGDIVIVKHPHKNISIIKRIQKIKNNKYYILGDNSYQSTDSRDFGYIDKSLIIAKKINLK